ncbi:glycosyltransferase family 4 protein [Pseudooceanicola sp.]|uniref:glycosyltransferase family 4 protein n=1 Tax=Pseudooceanicola sp. TaxID=1914328 RepID=UPI0035C71E06
MPDLLLNARFLMRPPTGVDRVAQELVAALLQLGLPEGIPRLRALRPRGDIVAPEARPAALLDLVEVSGSRLTGQAWEQLALARTRPDDILLSLCNTGPMRRHRQVVMLHDAQVFRQPDSYSPAFRRWYRLMQPRLARRCRMVLTVSDHARQELEHFGVVPPGKARIVPNGADHILRPAPDTGVLHRHGLEPGRYILAIGSLAPHKNIALLARAAQARKDRSLPLVIAGGGAPGVFAAAGLAPAPDLRIIGRVGDAELRALYEQATALAFPSLTEGFGLPPVEAMLCGCPVLATTGGAVPEVCGDAALMLDPQDQQGWTDALDRIATDAALRDRLRRAGLERGARYTWQGAAQHLLRHLAEVAAL